MNSQITFQPDKQFVPPEDEARKSRFMKHVKRLAIAEIVLGLLCVFLEIALLIIATPNKHYSVSIGSYRYTGSRLLYGVGLWCGAWICFAGISGVVAASNKVFNSRIYIHMGFCWLGFLFSAFLLGFSIPFALIASFRIQENVLRTFEITMYSLESVSAFVCACLHIASFVVSVKVVGCCEACCNAQQGSHVVYPGNTGFVQQPGVLQAGHSVQTYGQPSQQYSNSVQMTPGLPGPQPAPIQPGHYSNVS